MSPFSNLVSGDEWNQGDWRLFDPLNSGPFFAKSHNTWHSQRLSLGPGLNAFSLEAEFRRGYMPVTAIGPGGDCATLVDG